jgi:hypothetical protein
MPSHAPVLAETQQSLQKNDGSDTILKQKKWQQDAPEKES